MVTNDGFDRFNGSPEYVISQPLKNAVNVAIAY
jgi:hypothetical protein